MDEKMKAYDESRKKPGSYTHALGVTRAENDPSDALRLQGTLPDVLDPLVTGVTTADRAAERTDDKSTSDPGANRPLK